METQQTAPPSAGTRAKSEVEESKLPETMTKTHSTAKDVSTTTGSSSSPAEQLVNRIKSEHQQVKQCYDEYKKLTDVDQKLICGRKISELIVQHAGREECVLYPAMRLIPELGDKEVEKNKKEHQQVAEDLYKLDQFKVVDKDYDSLLCKVMKELNEHIEEEENYSLPKFVSNCSKYDAAKVKNDYESCTVTSLPHPSAPREGIAAKIAQAASVPLDAATKAMREQK